MVGKPHEIPFTDGNIQEIGSFKTYRGWYQITRKWHEIFVMTRKQKYGNMELAPMFILKESVMEN